MSERRCGTCKWWKGQGKKRAIWYACGHPSAVAINAIPKKLLPIAVTVGHMPPELGKTCPTYEARP